MKRLIYILMALACVTVSCSLDESAYLPDEKDGACIRFGCRIPDEIEISTRSIGSEVSQYRVNNVYVCLYDEGGSRIYGRYFTPEEKSSSPLGTTPSEIQANRNKWYFGRKEGAAQDFTYFGQINASLPKVENGKLYLIANVNLLDLTDELLDVKTSTLGELANILVSTTSNSLFRTRLIMTGGSDVQVGKDGKVSLTQPILLKRIDSKIKFNVRVASAAEQKAYNDALPPGDPKLPRIGEFEPAKWELRKVPKNVYLVNDIKTRSAEDSRYEYYDIEPANFETQTKEPDQHDGSDPADYLHDYFGFSFYMLENVQPVNPAVTDYHQRDVRKTVDNPGSPDHGAYDQSGEATGDIWEYAPKNGTYVKITGALQMLKNVQDEALGHPVETIFRADVAYYIHLGDISSAMGDFSVLRNTSYTYNIVIYGAEKIDVEVIKQIEEEPGAVGDTYKTREAYCEFDAHCSQRVLRFCAEHIEVSNEGKVNITWFVRTPFSEGEPKDGIGSLDYKWVHFMRNPVISSGKPDDPATDKVDESRIYSNKNCFYPGDASPKLMDVYEFTEYLVQQAKYWHWNKNHTEPGDYRYEQDFLPDYDGAHNSMYFTVFVDEYYYMRNPVTNEPVGWSQFVNKDDRMMHLLSSTRRSLDDESSVTESVVTLRQKAIQTPYTFDDNLTAWGVETYDEPVITHSVPGEVVDGVLTLDKMEYYPTFFYSENSLTPESFGSSETADGLTNTKVYFPEGTPWGDYLDISELTDLTDNSTVKVMSENDQPFLQTGKRTLKNSVLLRNRDSNGDGKINNNELKWYLADRKQITSLAMADVGVDGDAKLFTIENQFQYLQKQKWGVPDPSKFGISSSAASTAFKGLVRIVPSDGKGLIWTEELFSVSGYGQDYSWKDDDDAQYSVRCVRNLNGANSAVDDMIPRPTKNAQGNYCYDMTRVNRLSLRHRGVKVEPDLIILDASTEREENSFLPLGLEVYTGSEGLILYGNNYDLLQQDLVNGINPCPAGWRVPNLREVGLMYMHHSTDPILSDQDGPYVMVSTYYSLPHRKTWYLKGNHVTMAANAGSYIRCVRDWDPRTGK